MSEITTLAQATIKSTDKLTQELLDTFTDSYNEEIDKMFARLHAETTGDVNLNYDYDRKNFRRVGLKTREDVTSFVNYMKSRGIHVAVTANKYNDGQYLAEIQRHNQVEVTGSEEKKTINIDAETLLVQYHDETHRDVEDENAPQSVPAVASNPDFTSLLIQRLDTLGSVIHHIESGVDQLDQYGTRDLETKEIFDKDLTRDGKAHPKVDSGKSKTATVINHSIVVIDGKMVEDEKIRDEVLGQHQKRIKEAKKIVRETNRSLSSELDAMSYYTEETHHNEFQQREAERKRKFDAEETRRLREHTRSEAKKRQLFDASEEQRKQKIIAENAERIARGEPELVFVPNIFTEKPFVPRTFQSAEYHPLEQSIEDFYDKQTKNATAILQNTYRQEYVVKDYHQVNPNNILTSQAYVAMTNHLNRLNTDAITLNQLQSSDMISIKDGNILSQIAEDSKFSMTALQRKAIHKLRMASERDEIATLSAWERKAIVSVAANYVNTKEKQLDYVEETLGKRLNQSAGFTAGMANVFDDNIASNAKAQEMMALLEATDPSFNSISVEIGERVCSGLSFIGVVIVSFVLILMFLVQKICNVVWYYKAIMYKLEWIFRLAFTPIAFSDIYSGQNSRAISWFKGLIGMALYGMGFILLPAIGNGMAITHLASVIGNFQTGTDNGVWALIGSLLTCLVYPIATIGCLSVVRQVTKEVAS